ncbi:MAG: nucleoprotein [Sanya conocephalus maculatus rhabdovirus 1]|nr:MAG: nucleoprotein [Sanya conocephalus maculatus rhabdovirus 1]
MSANEYVASFFKEPAGQYRLTKSGPVPKTGWSDEWFVKKVSAQRIYVPLPLDERIKLYCLFTQLYYSEGADGAQLELLRQVILETRGELNEEERVFKACLKPGQGASTAESQASGSQGAPRKGAKWASPPSDNYTEETKAHLSNFMTWINGEVDREGRARAQETEEEEIEEGEAVQLAGDLTDQTDPNAIQLTVTLDPSDRQKKKRGMTEWLRDSMGTLLKTGPSSWKSETYKLLEQVGQLLGFCALVCLRGKVKDEFQIKRYFDARSPQVFLNLFTDHSFGQTLRPPSSEMLNLWCRVLKTSHSTAVQLFHEVVFEYYSYRIQPENETARKYDHVLEAGVLTHTSNNGMGLLTLFEAFKARFDLEDSYALSCIAYTSVAPSLAKIILFLKTYCRVAKPEITWRWARVLDNQYFMDLAIKMNKRLCARLAAIQEDIQHEIWSIKDLADMDEGEKENARIWASSLKSVLLSSVKDTAIGNAVSQETAAQFEAKRRERLELPAGGRADGTDYQSAMATLSRKI